MDQDKVACLPFCTCPCDFSLALVCILRRVFEQLVNSRAVTISLPPLPPTQRWSSSIACWPVLISVLTLCYGPGLLFRGPFCIYTFELLKVHVIRFRKYQPDDIMLVLVIPNFYCDVLYVIPVSEFCFVALKTSLFFFIKKQYPFRQISVIRKSHYVVTLKCY